MKLNKLTVGLFLINLFICESIVAQNYYYYIYDYDADTLKNVSRTENQIRNDWLNYAVIYWQETLPIGISISTFSIPPAYLFFDDYKDGMSAAINSWNTIFIDKDVAYDPALFALNENLGGVIVDFIYSSDIMEQIGGDPETTAGITLMETNYDHLTYTSIGSQIGFNSISVFLESFYWTWDSEPEYSSLDGKHGLDIQTIAHHELGHVGGLADFYAETEISYVMYYRTVWDASKRTLQTYDKNALRLLFGKKLVSPEIPK